MFLSTLRKVQPKYFYPKLVHQKIFLTQEKAETPNFKPKERPSYLHLINLPELTPTGPVPYAGFLPKIILTFLMLNTGTCIPCSGVNLWSYRLAVEI